MAQIVITLIVAGPLLAWLGWISVQSLRQGMMLQSLPKGIVGAMEGKTVAAHGTLKVLTPLEVPGLGSCLWHRRIEKELDSVASGLIFGRRRWRTVSDETSMAEFAIVVNGEDLEIGERPTEIHETMSRRQSAKDDFVDQLFSSDSTLEIHEWLPVKSELSVIGRLERREGRRVIVADPQLGLLLSPLPADRAGATETWKGIGGLLGVLTGVVFLVWLFNH